MKATKVAVLVVGFLAFGLTKAFAVPTIDGFVSPANEWANNGSYSYYLEINEPGVDPDNQFHNMDISHVVLLQDRNDADPAKDGVYLLIEVFAPPVSLKDPPDGPGLPPTPTAIPIVNMSGDFNNDGVYDINLRTFSKDPEGAAAPANDVTQVCLGSSASCDPIFGAWFDFASGGGVYKRGDVLEYFFPIGSFGTPNADFPQSFRGIITFDNGASGPLSADDVVMGGPLAVPEPGTMLLLGTGLAGLFFRRKAIAG